MMVITAASLRSWTAGVLGTNPLAFAAPTLVDEAQAVAAAPGHDAAALVPVEPEERLRRRRLEVGIELPEATVAELTQLGARYGVVFPDPASTEESR
jgi:LDH2 family malate/lactate/ureidoglycolate dehydrogenase